MQYSLPFQDCMCKVVKASVQYGRVNPFYFGISNADFEMPCITKKQH